MGAQITFHSNGPPKEVVGHENKAQHHGDGQINMGRMEQKPEYEFRRTRDILRLLQDFKQNQKKYRCPKRIELLQKIIINYDGQFERDNSHERNIETLFQKYKQLHVLPTLNQHEQFCFSCTGRHWEIKQWKIPHQQISIEQGNDYQMFRFKIRNQDEMSDCLEVIIYKYLKLGNGYLKQDKVRNMKIFKKPLSQWQLTNLIFQHQYLVVQCENSYWSFEKDTKRLIIQASVLLADVRDRIMGEKRINQMSFNWFGLRNAWYPQVMYESKDFVVQDIKEVRVFAEHIKQTSLKYNVFQANCKIYAQYVMKSSIHESSWKQIQTFFDFFHK